MIWFVEELVRGRWRPLFWFTARLYARAKLREVIQYDPTGHYQIAQSVRRAEGVR